MHIVGQAFACPTERISTAYSIARYLRTLKRSKERLPCCLVTIKGGKITCHRLPIGSAD